MPTLFSIRADLLRAAVVAVVVVVVAAAYNWPFFLSPFLLSI